MAPRGRHGIFPSSFFTDPFAFACPPQDALSLFSDRPRRPLAIKNKDVPSRSAHVVAAAEEGFQKGGSGLFLALGHNGFLFILVPQKSISIYLYPHPSRPFTSSTMSVSIQ